jgi:hypothetical protein
MALEPYWADDMVTLHVGDCLDLLREMPDASVDAVVTDPPAGVAFMNKDWDHDRGGRDQWITWLTERMAEAFRVLKPGGHALVWALPRTSHWTATALEDAGFTIRDCVVHLFGSGFPKSLDVGKAIDRQRDDRDAIVDVTTFVRQARLSSGVTIAEIDAAFGTNGMAWRWSTVKASPAVPNWDQWLKLKGLLEFGDDMDVDVWRLNGRKGQPGEAWADREVIGERTTGIGTGRGAVAYIGDSEDHTLTAAATEASKQWEGWGTALKPSQEHWWLVRRPLVGTVASNVLEYGTGALNIDACRVDAGDKLVRPAAQRMDNDVFGKGLGVGVQDEPAGRWPTNLVFSHSACCVEDGPCDQQSCPVAELDRQSGHLKSGLFKPEHADNGKAAGTYGAMAGRERATATYGDAGGASRFFPGFRYEAKAPSSERPKLDDGTTHATVKPLDLMRWLVRLITPPGGTVLDPFAGSGTTGEACVLEGFARC